MLTRPGGIFPSFKQPYKRILVIRCNGVSDFRVELAARHLVKAGYDVDIISEVPFYSSAQYDIFLCSRPSDGMCEFLDTCIRANRKVIIDMDDDFLNIPPHNEAYKYVGAGNMGYHKKLLNVMERSNVVYASQELINRYKLPGIVIPNCYDEDNPFWDLPKVESEYFRLGFTGTRTHREDFKMILPAIRQVLSERPDVQLVVGLDEQILSNFTGFPRIQFKYIPPLVYAEYPQSFRHIDLLLVPLINNTFNLAKSDIKLVEAGASRTCYVASAMPVYSDWQVLTLGGYISGPEEWYKSILHAIEFKEISPEHAESGHALALSRTSAAVFPAWLRLIEEL